MFKITKVTLVIFGFMGAWAFADWDPNAVYDGHVEKAYDMGARDQVLQKLTEAQAFDSQTLTDCNCTRLSQIPIQDPRCRKAYQNLYDKPDTNFKIILGYNDMTPQPTAIDPIFAYNLKVTMTGPCLPNTYFCGFRQEFKDDDEKYQKVIVGPDGKPRKVHITLVNAALTGLREQDKARWEEQQEKSDHADREMLDFEHSDVTMFIGHARNGCGLGNHMPSLNQVPTKYKDVDGTMKTKMVNHVDYKKECDQHGTMAKITAALSAHQPKIFSQFACRSNPGMETLLNQFPKMAIQRSAEYDWPQDWHYHILGTLNGWLGQICEPALSKIINPPITSPAGRKILERFF